MKSSKQKTQLVTMEINAAFTKGASASFARACIVVGLRPVGTWLGIRNIYAS